MSVKILQLHKQSSLKFENIQDKYAVNFATCCLAIADGTTQSFRSETWARIVTEKFIVNPVFDKDLFCEFLKECSNELYAQQIQFSSNPAIASLEKAKFAHGSATTFIGIKYTSDDICDLICCGDSNAYFIREGKIIESFPFEDVETLSSNQNFINSRKVESGEFKPDNIKIARFHVKPLDEVILASDAIAKLILQNPIFTQKVRNIRNFDEWLELVEYYWNKRILEDDDLTVLILRFDGKDQESQYNPNRYFTFPQPEEKPPFVPNLSELKSALDESILIPSNRQLDYRSPEIDSIITKLRVQETINHSQREINSKVKKTFIVCYSLVVILFLFQSTIQLKKNLFPTKKIEEIIGDIRQGLNGPKDNPTNVTEDKQKGSLQKK